MSWAYMNGYMQQRGMYTRRCIFAEQLEKQKIKHVKFIVNEIISQLSKTKSMKFVVSNKNKNRESVTMLDMVSLYN